MHKTRGRSKDRLAFLALAFGLLFCLCLPVGQDVAVPEHRPATEVSEMTAATGSIRFPDLRRSIPFERPDVVFLLYLVGRLFRLALYGALILVGLLLLRNSGDRGHTSAPPPVEREPVSQPVKKEEISRLESQIEQLKEELDRLQQQDDEHTDSL